MKRDFASVLDEILVERGEEAATGPNVAVDCLGVLDELNSSGAGTSHEEATAGYRETVFEDAVIEELELAAERVLAPIDRDAMARELGLWQIRSGAELDALRRRFALDNHPDRVAPELRDTAMQRMQMANMLIDEAKRQYARAL